MKDTCESGVVGGYWVQVYSLLSLVVSQHVPGACNVSQSTPWLLAVQICCRVSLLEFECGCLDREVRLHAGFSLL